MTSTSETSIIINLFTLLQIMSFICYLAQGIFPRNCNLLFEMQLYESAFETLTWIWRLFIRHLQFKRKKTQTL